MFKRNSLKTKYMGFRELEEYIEQQKSVDILVVLSVFRANSLVMDYVLETYKNNREILKEEHEKIWNMVKKVNTKIDKLTSKIVENGGSEVDQTTMQIILTDLENIVTTLVELEDKYQTK